VVDRVGLRRIGIIGCGAIGNLIAEAVDKDIVKCDGLILYDYNAGKAQKLMEVLTVSAKVAQSVDEMIRLKPVVVVEAASQQAARDYALKILGAGIELVVMSVGGLLDLDLGGKSVQVPSGAIGGLDAIRAAALIGIDEVILTSRKSPPALGKTGNKEQVVFDGNAHDAVRLFPREMNVAATLALAVSPDRIKVRVVADPKVTRNVHDLDVKWKHGEMSMRFENDPHPDNPKTSALAAWSAIRLLKDTLEDRGQAKA